MPASTAQYEVISTLPGSCVNRQQALGIPNWNRVKPPQFSPSETPSGVVNQNSGLVVLYK
jgi:hypothetical protein